jgi:hypothetical protein
MDRRVLQGGRTVPLFYRASVLEEVTVQRAVLTAVRECLSILAERTGNSAKYECYVIVTRIIVNKTAS